MEDERDITVEEEIIEEQVEEESPDELEEEEVLDEEESEEEPQLSEADELRAQLEAKESELSGLKGRLDEIEGRLTQQSVSAPTPQTDTRKNITAYERQIVPQLRAAFDKTFDKDTGQFDSDKQFSIIKGLVDTAVNAVLNDIVYPSQNASYSAAVDQYNEFDIRDLRDEPGFKEAEQSVRKELAKLPLAQRAKEGVIKQIFYQLKGAGSVKIADGLGEKPVIKKKVVSDISPQSRAGSGKKPAATANLSAESEKDWRENYPDMPQKEYKRQLIAWNNRRKEKGLSPVKTLRG